MGEKDGVKAAVHFELLGDASVSGIIAVDENLDSCIIREVKSECRVCGRAAGPLEDLANDFAWVYTDMVEAQRVGPFASGSG